MTPGGVSGVINGNLFLGTGTINGQARGMAMELGNLRPGSPTIVSNNVVADGTGSAFAAIMLEYGSTVSNPADAVGINDLTIDSNIVYQWDKGLGIQDGLRPGGSGATGLNGLTVRDNVFQKIASPDVVQQGNALDSAAETFTGNQYGGSGADASLGVVQSQAVSWKRWVARVEPSADASLVAYVEPSRSAAAYSASLGGGATDSAFLADARGQSSQSWSPQLTSAALLNYVRDGFNVSGQPARDWRIPTPPTAAAAFPNANLTTDDTSLTFTVTYQDVKPLDLTSLGDTNFTMVNARGRISRRPWSA